MSGPLPQNDPAATEPRGSRWAPATRLGKLGHVLFWTALFYGLTWGIARLCQWLSP
ncbi:MAG: hypothetical protein P1P84_00075 [Deferrisomatales bacterium]|nr:hypothetical protein [Deferrisomatales bacterium]